MPGFTSDFLPINLINSSIKIILKILATKLSKFIDKLLNLSQSTFIKGRNILDNVVVVQEVIFHIQKHRSTGNIIKFDFSKAFDMLD